MANNTDLYQDISKELEFPSFEHLTLSVAHIAYE